MSSAQKISTRLWKSLGGELTALKSLSFTSTTEQIYPSVYDVDGFAAASIGVANLAAAELMQKRSNSSKNFSVQIDRREACAAFNKIRAQSRFFRAESSPFYQLSAKWTAKAKNTPVVFLLLLVRSQPYLSFAD